MRRMREGNRADLLREIAEVVVELVLGGAAHGVALSRPGVVAEGGGGRGGGRRAGSVLLNQQVANAQGNLLVGLAKAGDEREGWWEDEVVDGRD